ncbi:MAG: hypothetical protein JWP25_8984 [Bradyrhizobium sp.]|nr:hypothetical protein [Bradyrhizobium sp.]
MDEPVSMAATAADLADKIATHLKLDNASPGFLLNRADFERIVTVLRHDSARSDLDDAKSYFLQQRGLWEEFADSYARDRTHKWFYYDGVKGDCCQKCGIVRRADRMNNPCKGPVKVGPRVTRT